jgi:hypothetical protein
MREYSRFCNKKKNTLEKFVLSSMTEDICISKVIELTTSADLRLSESASDTLEAVLPPLEEKNVHNGAIYAIDNTSGKVLIYIGNRRNANGNAIDMISEPRSV